jgi:hypothetical protein
MLNFSNWRPDLYDVFTSKFELQKQQLHWECGRLIIWQVSCCLVAPWGSLLVRLAVRWGERCIESCQSESESESELLYNWRSVSQYVLVSSPIWDFWPGIFYLFIFFLSYSLVLFGAPSLTRGRVRHLSVYSQSTVVSIYIKYLHTVLLTFTIFTLC